MFIIFQYFCFIIVSTTSFIQFGVSLRFTKIYIDKLILQLISPISTKVSKTYRMQHCLLVYLPFQNTLEFINYF